ncbi:hypothetical protein D3C79_532240 [compost metagenome]
MGERFQHIHHRLAARAQVGEGDAEQGAEQQNRQDLVLGEGIGHAAGYHMQQEIDEAAAVAGCRGGVGGDALGIEGGRVDVHALAGLHDVDHHQPQYQGKGGQHFEVDQRAHADAAEFLHVFHLGDAQHHRGEDDRGEDHLDQFDEGITDGLQVSANLWPEHPDQHPEGYADQYLYVELAEQSLGHCRLRIIVVSRIYLAAGLLVRVQVTPGLGGRRAQLSCG